MRASEFLIEDRISHVADQLDDKLLTAYKRDMKGNANPDVTAIEIVNQLAKASTKAIQWLANRYVSGEFKLEDVSRVKQDLMKFAQVKSKLPADQKDLNRLSLKDLYKVLKPYEDKEVVSNKEKDRTLKKQLIDTGEATVIHKSKNLVVLKPNTEEASCYFGKGTKWCTAGTKGDNAFNDYGDLYIIMTKEGKFQVAPNAGDHMFMNAEDMPLTRKEYLTLINKYPLLDIFDKIATENKYFPLMKNQPDEFIINDIDNSFNDTEDIMNYVRNPSDEVVIYALQHCNDVAEIYNNLDKPSPTVTKFYKKLAPDADSELDADGRRADGTWPWEYSKAEQEKRKKNKK